MKHQKIILGLCLIMLSRVMLGTIQDTYRNNVNALPTTCEKLKYMLLNKIVNGQITVEAILGYVIFEDFPLEVDPLIPISMPIDLNCCDLGFRPEDPNALPYKADLAGLQVINGTARGARFEHAFLDRARFDGSDLGPGTLADGCEGQPTSFEHSIVHQGAFISFIGTPTNYVKLMKANISLVHWHDAIFKYVDLTDADFTQSDLHVVLFSGANLTRANFTHTRIRAAVCDPNNPPVVRNTILSSGRRTSSAAEFCRSFNHSVRVRQDV